MLELRETTQDVFTLFFILCIMGWSLAPPSNSIRGFQDIKMRLPKLSNANFAGKMMEFR